MRIKLLGVIMALGLCILPQKGLSHTECVEFYQEPVPKIDVKVYNNKHNDISVKYKKIKETDTELWIEPSGSYYNKYVSNNRFDADIDENMFDIYYEYPTINCYVINNSKHSLNISNLQLNVESSQIDKLPYIYIISTLYDTNCITFYNFSCFNWGNMTFEYTILCNGEHFDNRYKKRRIIPFFSSEYKMDFRSDLEELGYRVDMVEYYVHHNRDFANSYYGAYTQTEINQYGHLFHPFLFTPFSIISDDYYSYSQEEYYIPIAPIYGRISFSQSNMSFSFKGYICLASVDGLGAITFLDDSFNIKLKTSASNYSLYYPYKTVIPPGGSECIRLKVTCDKSSNHRFRIKAINYEGHNITSKYINLHMLNHQGVHIVTDEEMNKDL